MSVRAVDAPLPVTAAAPAGPLAFVRRLRERTGLPMVCVERERGVVLGDEGDLPPFVPGGVLARLTGVNGPAVFPLRAGLCGYAAPVPGGDGRYFAFGYQLAAGAPIPADLVIAAAGAGWTRERLDRWAAVHPRCSTGPLRALLALALREEESERAVAADAGRIDALTEQLHHTYEEVTLLHALTRNLQISRGPADLANLCLDRLPELIDAEGHLIRIEPPGEPSRTLTRGAFPFDPEEIADVLGRFEPHDPSRPLVRNHVGATPLAGVLPGLTNLVAVPVREGRHRFGWIVSVNMADGKEFGTVEANLLNTVATILGTHVRNIDLLREQNDLLVGFVRSLVSTLDAKDPYTRGHSERVALIARRIGKEMRLPEEELKTIHLAGLLHDIGKIGVDDRILRKDGPLTDEEFDQVKKHPMIGYNILSGLKNLRHVLPGVRHHHENFDGSGYPDRLAGEDIPMLARVLAVADGYDAMGSDRPYRKGMPAERIDDVFRRGADRQWDPRVLDAYFRCRDDVRLLCAAHTLENGCPIGGVPQGAAML